MGSLDKSNAVTVKKTAKVVDITGFTIAQIESGLNTYLNKGWNLIQVVVVGTKIYVIAVKEE